MPIDPDIREHYPDDWDDIREQILQRATLQWHHDTPCPRCDDQTLTAYTIIGDDEMEEIDSPAPCCEWCGRPNGMVSSPQPDKAWAMDVYESCMECGFTHDIRLESLPHQMEPLADGRLSRLGDATRCVLTIAHLDQDPRIADPERLRALCQRCHLTYDNQPQQRAKRERIYAELRGQQSLLEDTCPA